jgi:purine-binding chemotaxis protein CheW
MSEVSNPGEDPLAERLSALREEFDSSFSRPLKVETERGDSALCFTVDGLRYAVLLSGLQSLSRCLPLVAVPSRSRSLLGLAVMHAQAVPVYSLPRITRMSAPRGEYEWLAMLRGSAAVGLAVQSLDGYAQTAPEMNISDGHTPFVSGMVKHKGFLYALIDAAGLYQAITQQSADLEKG